MTATKFTLDAQQGTDGLWRGMVTSDDSHCLTASITTPDPAILLGELARMLNLDLGAVDRDSRGQAQSALKRSALAAQCKLIWTEPDENGLRTAAVIAEARSAVCDGGVPQERKLVLAVLDSRTRFDFSINWEGQPANRLVGGYGLHAEGSMLKCEHLAWDYLHANGWSTGPAFDWEVK